MGVSKVRKLPILFLVALVASCTTPTTVTLNKPALPIFSLNKSDSYQKRLNAYKDSLDLMMIYSNELERIVKQDHHVEYNLINYTGKDYGKGKTTKH
jgi:lipoprotein